ncbi:MAG TPA: WbqC family protein, partial [Pseudonocardiaceae bacterium]
MAIVSVHQPNFMPWTKLLAKIVASDVYVAYDSVQFNKREFHARQRFATARGAAVFLSVPVRHTGNREVIRDMRIVNEQPWRERHLEFLAANYGSTPYFGEVFPIIEGVYATKYELLVDHNVRLIEAFCGYLGAGTRVVRSSTLPHDGSREERLLELVRAVGGDEHLT